MRAGCIRSTALIDATDGFWDESLGECLPGILVLGKWFSARLTLKLCILSLESLIKCLLDRSSCEERIIWTKEIAASYSINRN